MNGRAQESPWVRLSKLHTTSSQTEVRSLSHPVNLRNEACLQGIDHARIRKTAREKQHSKQLRRYSRAVLQLDMWSNLGIKRMVVSVQLWHRTNRMEPPHTDSPNWSAVLELRFHDLEPNPAPASALCCAELPNRRLTSFEEPPSRRVLTLMRQHQRSGQRALPGSMRKEMTRVHSS